MVRNLVYLPSREVEAAFARGVDLLVVPVGGTHFAGRELPFGFTNVLAEAFAAAIAEAGDGFYLPVIPYSPGEGVGHLPGSVCPAPSAFLAYVGEVVDQAIANEFKRVVVLLEGHEGYLVSVDAFERNDHPVLIISYTSLMSHDDLAGDLAPAWHKQVDVFLGALKLLGREDEIPSLIDRLRALPAAEDHGLSANQFTLVDVGNVDAFCRSDRRSRLSPDVRFDATAGQAYIRAVANKLRTPLAELGRYADFIRRRPTFKKNSEGRYGWPHAE